MDRKHIIQKGFPFTIYHNVSDTMAFSVCIPFEKDGLAEGNIQIGRFTPAVAVLADYFGPYTTLGNAHVALQQWIAESQLEMYGDPIEMYVTGPPEWTDSTRWHTKIYYPVK